MQWLRLMTNAPNYNKKGICMVINLHFWSVFPIYDLGIHPLSLGSGTTIKGSPLKFIDTTSACKTALLTISILAKQVHWTYTNSIKLELYLVHCCCKSNWIWLWPNMNSSQRIVTSRLPTNGLQMIINHITLILCYHLVQIWQKMQLYNYFLE